MPMGKGAVHRYVPVVYQRFSSWRVPVVSFPLSFWSGLHFGLLCAILALVHWRLVCWTSWPLIRWHPWIPNLHVSTPVAWRRKMTSSQISRMPLRSWKGLSSLACQCPCGQWRHFGWERLWAKWAESGGGWSAFFFWSCGIELWRQQAN